MKKPEKYRYTTAYKDRHGKWRRQGNHTLIEGRPPLPLDLSTGDGAEQYSKWLKRVESAKAGITPLTPGSLSELIDFYKRQPEFQSLKPVTRRVYNRYLLSLDEDFGDLKVSGLTTPSVVAIRDLYKSKPRTANGYLQTLSILMGQAMLRGQRSDNPVLAVPKLKQGDGSRPWTLLDLQRIRRVASKEFLWVVATLLFSGQRQGDAIQMVRSRFKGGMYELVQNKRGKRVYIPVHPLWAKIMADMPQDNVLLLTTIKGQPWKLDHLRSVASRYIKEANLDALAPGQKISLHGLRKTAIGVFAEMGLTRDEIISITGQSSGIVDEYLARYNKKKISRNAGAKMLNLGKKRLGTASDK